MLLQMEQRRSFSRSTRMASASDLASASLERSTWKARRCADLVPIPGSFFSSSMRRDIGSANRDIRRATPVLFQAGEVEASGESAHDAGDARLHGFVGASARLVDSGGDQVFEQFDVRSEEGRVWEE